jgi:hypothetical protein
MSKHKLQDIPRGDYVYPRTLSEAFCGTPTGLTPEHAPMSSRDKWFVGAVLCVFALWVALMLAGVIPK